MIVFSLAFLVVLLDWRLRRRWMRMVSVAAALALWFFAQPSYTVAARRASTAPPSERITQFRGAALTEYLSGVETMREAVLIQVDARSAMRLLALGVLSWLALLPLRSAHKAGDLATTVRRPSSG
jgi:hypothetical protein